MMSRVDVIVPCYNYGRFLRECVRSVLTQDGVGVRVLVIDDASKDDSAEVAAGLAREDSRIEFRRHERNWGHIETYNEGLEWASGEYLLLLSADDLLTPGALRRASRVLDAHPNVGLTHGPAIKTRAPGSPVPGAPEDDYRVVPGPEWVEAVCRAGANAVETPTAVVRTWLQKQIGGYRKDLPHSGDMAMWLRFAAHADVGRIDASQAYYRLHGQNMSVGYRDVAELLQRKAAFDVLFEDDQPRLPERERLRSLAYRALAEQAFWIASDLFDAGNQAASRGALRTSLELDPGLRHSRMWQRLRCKRLIGTRASAVLQRLASQWRARPALAGGHG
jgi:glycosyltransferase involved in cell wall biosynthesis